MVTIPSLSNPPAKADWKETAMSTSISFPQVTKIVDTLGEKGVTSELVQDDLLGKGRLADLAEAAVRGTIPDRETFRKLLGLLVATFRLIIDYTMSLADMITAGGYDWVNPNITEANFPIMMKGKFNLDAELFHFNRNISSEDAVEEMRKTGCRGAMIEELLSFGAKNLELQRQFPIVALGSSCVLRGDRQVAYLVGGGFRRFLILDVWVGDWGGDVRFLGVRN